MRLVVMNRVERTEDIEGFLQHVRLMAIDTLLVLSTEQTSRSGVPSLLTDVTLANDGMSRLYCDNPLVSLQQGLQGETTKWHLGWVTQTLRTMSQQGVGLLTKLPIGAIWYRVISPHIQIQVIELGTYVIGIITVTDVRLVRQKMLQRVHDLLKAQVKPVLLFGPSDFSADLVRWGWLAKQEFTQQALSNMWVQEVWCDCANEVTVVQQCVMPNRQIGLLIDFKRV